MIDKKLEKRIRLVLATAYAKATTGRQTLLDMQPWHSPLARPQRADNRTIRLRAGGKGRVTTKHPN